ncbi:MAG: S41 family peptidase [Tissierellia bacterium]|nr:S41 family peptidase [Tissierellia bacterium]
MKKQYIILLFLLTMSLALIIQLMESPVMSGGEQISLSKAEYYQMAETQQRFQKLLDLEHEIHQKYYLDTGEIDFDTALYRGLFGALDKYSSYFTPEEYEDYTAGLSGEIVGIGTTIEAYDDVVRVVQPIADGPAERAGILAEDIIWKVDQTELAGLTLDESVDLMRGEAGTAVTIFVRRGSEDLEFRLIRARITTSSVNWEVRDGQIGYIRISHFEQPTANQFRQAMRQLEQEDIRGLVIDLRSNPGGYLHSVVEVAQQILDETTIVTEVSRDGREKVYASQSGNKLEIPYVVLVNRSSASASEIMAGAIQDTESAKIIGETTTGKGVVQTSYRLADGSGFRVTTARYLTPAGRDIHGVGIEPDITIEAIEQAGYPLPESLRLGAEDDAVLNYAVDFLKALVAMQ